MAYTKQFLAAFFLLVGCQVVTAQDELDEQVPYQGDTLLTNPTKFGKQRTVISSWTAIGRR